LIDGRLVFQQWTAQDGSKRSKHAITVENLQMLDSKADSQNPSYNNGYDNQPAQNSYGNSGYSNPPQQQGYAQPQQQTSQQPAYSAPQQPTQPSVPEIDIDEDEIPF
ncbi:MAG: single-stranded DNA-binding protein, partial [Epsilonproteobacteria bacterium]|nr:single-stranded DNA-binding protein [Campylobacterota bacterium]